MLRNRLILSVSRHIILTLSILINELSIIAEQLKVVAVEYNSTQIYIREIIHQKM